jgi:hypothetical protein
MQPGPAHLGILQGGGFDETVQGPLGWSAALENQPNGAGRTRRQTLYESQYGGAGGCNGFSRDRIAKIGPDQHIPRPFRRFLIQREGLEGVALGTAPSRQACRMDWTVTDQQGGMAQWNRRWQWRFLR